MGIGSNQNDLGYLKGRQRIVSDRNGQTHVVEYNPDLDAPFVRGPEREVANPIIFDVSTRTGWQTMIDYPVSRDLSLNVWTESPDVSEQDPAVGPSPFTISPDFDAGGIPFGGATAVGRVEIGHLGVSRDIYFNAGAGEMFRFAASGETLRYEPLLFPKFFTANDTASTLYRIYTLPDGTPLTNLEFNNPSARVSNAMFSSTVTQRPILSRSARSWAYTSTGTAYNDVRSRPQRKFFGSIGAATPGQAVRVPVAWNATHVEITGSPLTALGAAVPLIVYQQYQNVPPPPAGAGVQVRTVGGQVAGPGIAIPLINNVEWIYVKAFAAIDPAAQETLFEVNYWLGT